MILSGRMEPAGVCIFAPVLGFSRTHIDRCGVKTIRRTGFFKYILPYLRRGTLLAAADDDLERLEVGCLARLGKQLIHIRLAVTHQNTWYVPTRVCSIPIVTSSRPASKRVLQVGRSAFRRRADSARFGQTSTTPKSDDRLSRQRESIGGSCVAVMLRTVINPRNPSGRFRHAGGNPPG